MTLPKYHQKGKHTAFFMPSFLSFIFITPKQSSNSTTSKLFLYVAENVSFEPKIFALNLAAPPDRPSIMGDGLHYTLRRLNVSTVSHQVSDSVAKNTYSFDPPLKPHS